MIGSPLLTRAARRSRLPHRRGGPARRSRAACDARAAPRSKLTLEHLARHARDLARPRDVQVAHERVARSRESSAAACRAPGACDAGRRTSRRARESGSSARTRRPPPSCALEPCGAVLGDEGVRILALGQRHDPHRRRPCRSSSSPDAERRLEPCLVAVVEEEHALGVFANELRLLLGERGAHRRDHFGRCRRPSAGSRRSSPRRRASGPPLRIACFAQFNPYSSLSLGEDVATRPSSDTSGFASRRAARPPNPDDVARDIVDREHQAVAKPRTRLGPSRRCTTSSPASTLRSSSKPSAASAARIAADSRGANPSPNRSASSARHAARREIVARRLCPSGDPTAASKKLGGGRVHFPERLARIALLGVLRDFAHLDARLLAHPLHRLDEVEAEVLLDEGEDVARLAAHEAVVAAVRRHGKVGSLP